MEDQTLDVIGTLVTVIADKARDLDRVIKKKNTSAKDRNMAIGALTAYLDVVDTVHELTDTQVFMETNAKGN